MAKAISNKIFEQLQSDILAGTYPIGSRLPPERELTETFNTSRNTIRDALARLQYLKLVEKIPQSGTYVTDYKKNASLPLLIHYINQCQGLDIKSLASFMDLRLVAEIFVVKRAVHNISAGDIETFSEMLKKKDENRDDIEQVIELDFQFHSLVFQKAESIAFQVIFNAMKPVYTHCLHYFYAAEDAFDTLELQQRVVEAMSRKDEEVSSFLMEKLILFGINRIKSELIKRDLKMKNRC